MASYHIYNTAWAGVSRQPSYTMVKAISLSDLLLTSLLFPLITLHVLYTKSSFCVGISPVVIDLYR